MHVRLIGINTPEIAHFGQARASASASARREHDETPRPGAPVTLEPGRERHDRYGRLLAYVRVLGGPADLERTLLAPGSGAHARHSAERRPRGGLRRGARAGAPSGPRALGRLPGGLRERRRGRSSGCSRLARVSDEITELRAIVAGMPPAPQAMAPYLAQVREQAYAVTDADVER